MRWARLCRLPGPVLRPAKFHFPAPECPRPVPEAVVNDYILLIYDEDYESAFEFIGKDVEFEEFEDHMKYQNQYIDENGVVIGKTIWDNDSSARVELTIVQEGGGLFISEYSEFSYLEKNEDGIWLITEMPYMFWNYGWGR